MATSSGRRLRHSGAPAPCPAASRRSRPRCSPRRMPPQGAARRGQARSVVLGPYSPLNQIGARTVSPVIGPGSLDWHEVTDDLVAAPVAAALSVWELAAGVQVAEIDESLADTASFCQMYEVAPEQSANCVLIAGRRGETTSYAACVVLATTRADVNGVVRRIMGARKASFASMEDAVARSGMEFGGITPIGLPYDWPVFIDAAVARSAAVVIGSGLRRSKLALPGESLARLPGAQVIDDLAS